MPAVGAYSSFVSTMIGIARRRRRSTADERRTGRLASLLRPIVHSMPTCPSRVRGMHGC
jgi:hypothetical protein